MEVRGTSTAQTERAIKRPFTAAMGVAGKEPGRWFLDKSTTLLDPSRIPLGEIGQVGGGRILLSTLTQQSAKPQAECESAIGIPDVIFSRTGPTV